MRKTHRHYVRQMPKIYGNVQRPRRSFSGLFSVLKSLAGLLVIVGLGYLFFYGPIFRVRAVQVEGTALTSSERVSNLVQRNQSMWTVPESTITQATLQDPLVLSVGIYRSIPSTLRIIVQEKEPAIAWHTGETVVLLDSDGYAFAEFTPKTLPAADTPAGQKIGAIPHVYDVKALPVGLNNHVASSIFVNFLTEAKKQFAEHLPDLEITHMEIADTTYDLTVTTKQGMKIHMNSLADAGVQVRNLTRLIHQKKVTANGQVDLRIDRWAYVR